MPQLFANANYDFIGRTRLLVSISVITTVASLGVLVVNRFVRGSALNYGTDFRGGSEIQIEFGQDVGPAKVRSVLAGGGYHGAEVVSIKDPKRRYFYLLRLSEVAAYTNQQLAGAKTEVEKLTKVVKFDHPEQGDKVYVRFDKSVEPAAIQKAFEAAGIAAREVQTFGRADDHSFQVALGGLDIELHKLFDTHLGAGAVKDIPSIESVGAKVGAQLRDDGIKSVVYSLLLILVYVWFRFDLQFAPGGVIALLHDVIIVTGILALFWREFTLQTVAALLTIAGYSINDSIVVFDRIRENLVKLRDRKIPVLVNSSINETLSRTLLTGVTTLTSTISIWYFIRGPVRDFAMTMTIGILVGTYSSIFVAAPVYIWLDERLGRKARRA